MFSGRIDGAPLDFPCFSVLSWPMCALAPQTRVGWIQGVINKERQALLEEIIGGLPKSKGIEQEGLIYDLYTKIGWNDYRNAANEYLLSVLNRRRTDETNLYTINSASCCGVYPDRLLLE